VTGRKLLWQIVLPAPRPISSPACLSLALPDRLVISEMVAASSGIGYFILSAQRGFKIREMSAACLTLAALVILNGVFLAIENACSPGHYGYTQQQPTKLIDQGGRTRCPVSSTSRFPSCQGMAGIPDSVLRAASGQVQAVTVVTRSSAPCGARGRRRHDAMRRHRQA